MAIERVYSDHCLLIAKTGFGKCVVSQTAAQELIEDGVLSRVIVFAPLKVCRLTWAVDHLKWKHLWVPGMALGDAQQRYTAIADKPPRGLTVMNLDNLPWFFDTFGHDHGFDGIIIDESSKLKSPGGAMTSKLRYFTGDFRWRLAMTGTPVSECGRDIYTQALFADEGKALGINQEEFQRKYFMQMDYQGRKWAFQPGGLKRLSKKLRKIVWVADSTEYEAELPPVIDHFVTHDLNKTAKRVYNEMCTDGLAVLKNEGSVEFEGVNAAVIQNKLQLICCGALYDAAGDTHWLHKKKYKALDALIDDINAPVIIVYQWIYEREELLRRYPDALFDPTPDDLAAWDRGAVDILCIHPKSGGHGLNLQYGGNHMIFLSPLWSAELWTQLIDRIRRRGQLADTVFRHVLMAKKYVEKLIIPRQLSKAEKEQKFIKHLKEHQL